MSDNATELRCFLTNAMLASSYDECMKEYVACDKFMSVMQRLKKFLPVSVKEY